MRSVRLGDELERRLERAADASGQTASEIVRRAVREQCDRILGKSVYETIQEAAGIAADSNESSAARRSKASEFGDYIADKHSPRRRRRLGTRRGRPRKGKGGDAR